MAIIEVVTPYEVLARWTPEGLQGCHKIERKQFIEDSTSEVLADTLTAATAITKEEAVTILTNAVLAPTDPGPDAGEGEDTGAGGEDTAAGA